MVFSERMAFLANSPYLYRFHGVGLEKRRNGAVNYQQRAQQRTEICQIDISEANRPLLLGDKKVPGRVKNGARSLSALGINQE